MKTLLLATLISILAIPSTAADSPAGTKIYGIAYVKFKSTDLEKSKAFYGTIVGLSSQGSGCSGVAALCFAVNDQQHIELVPAAPGTTGPYLVEIGFNVSDVTQLLNYFTAKGVPATKIRRRPDGVPYFETQDPEHNKIVFLQRQPANSTSTPSDNAISHTIIHAGFVTKDSGIENKFYEDLLGFHVYWKGGRTDTEVDWFMNQVPDGDNWIEYMLNIPANATQRELGIQYHVSLGVQNIDETANLLKSRGAAFPPPITGRDGKRQLTLLDPDLTRIEVMEFTPVENPCCSPYTGPHPKP